MSAVKYWPYPVVVLLVALALALVALIITVAQLRTGVWQRWPYMAGTALVLVGLALITAFASRPPLVTAPAPPASATTIAEFEAYVAELLETGDPPGMSVVVVKDGAVVYAKGFGEADGPRQLAATPDTAYRWWSITKVFTAVAIMQLNEQGLVDLDVPVADYLPSFQVRYPSAATRPITIRDLLTHSSGLPDAGQEILGWIHFEGDAHADQSELLARTLPQYSGLLAAPGEHGRYTNIGYMVLAAVIEEATGQGYEDYVSAQILEPLGMSFTGFAPTPHMEAAAASHPVDLMAIPASFVVDLDRAVREREHGRLWFNPVYPDQTGPSGLLGSPQDMARFMMAMLAHGELDGARVMTPASVEAMGVRHVDAHHSPASVPGMGFALGWFHLEQDGRVSLTHGGQGMGTASLMRLYPQEDLGIVVAANSTYLGRNFGQDAIDVLSGLSWELVTAPGD